MCDELKANSNILASPPFVKEVAPQARRQVYPRIHLSAVNAVLSAAVLFSRRDETLSRMLHEWRNEVEIFNHQLSVAEILAFTVGSNEVLRQLHEGLHSADGPLESLRSQLSVLLATFALETRPQPKRH